MIIIVYENNNTKGAQWVKYSTRLKFQSSIFSSKKVEIVWNFYNVLNSFIAIMWKIAINLNNFWNLLPKEQNNITMYSVKKEN